MIEVKLYHEKPMSIMAIVAELRELGYIQRRDFDFSYVPATWDNDGAQPRHTIFTFYREDLSSYFVLRYMS